MGGDGDHAGDGFVVGLIGAGIGASLSPALHEREASRLGLRYRYELIDLDDPGRTGAGVGELLRAARGAGFSGLNVTHPCKQAVLEHLDELSPDAAALGAVNTVVFDDGRAIGHNTDASGFAESFARGLSGAALGRVVLIGAGGAGAAVAHAALTLGAGRLAIVDAEPGRARGLARSLGGRFGAERVLAADALADALAEADGLIHATPTGMASRPGTAVPRALLRPGLWVADIVYRPLETELLRDARAAGCRTLDGGGMAVFQAADALRLFTGRTPDRERMLRDLAAIPGAR
jgi:shikimate dehydrogenase